MPDSLSPPNRALNCSEVRDDLHSLLCNELEEAEAQPILAHLQTCAECRAALSDHAKLSGIISEHLPLLSKTVFKPYFRYN